MIATRTGFTPCRYTVADRSAIRAPASSDRRVQDHGDTVCRTAAALIPTSWRQRSHLPLLHKSAIEVQNRRRIGDGSMRVRCSNMSTAEHDRNRKKISDFK